MKKTSKILLKTISLLLCAVMVPCINFYDVFADDSDVNMLFNENFEAFTEGAFPKPHWEVSLNDNSCVVEYNQFMGSKAARMTNDASSGTMYLQNGTLSIPASGKVCYEVDFVADIPETSNIYPIRFRDRNAVFLTPVYANGGKLYLFDETEVGNVYSNVPVSVDIAMDFKAKTVSIWIDGKKKADNLSWADTGFDQPGLFRIIASSELGGGSVWFDNIYVYESESIISDEKRFELSDYYSEQDVAYKMQDAVAMYENRENALVFGSVVKNVSAPFLQNGSTYVPLKFLCDVYRAKFTTTAGKSTVDFEGKAYTVGKDADFEAVVKNDTIYVTADDASVIFDKELLSDECGLVIFSNEKDFLNWTHNRPMLNAIVRAFIYDSYSGDELLSMLKTYNPASEHPRLLVRSEDVDRIKRLTTDSELFSVMYDQCYEEAEYVIPVEPTEYVDDMLEPSRSALNKMQSLGMAYLLSGEQRFAERIRKELMAVCEFPDWNPSHFLDVAEMSAAVSLGYDWAYDYLTEDERKTIEQALVNNAIIPLLDKIDKGESFWANGGTPNNWVYVCFGGVSMAALAIGDRVDGETAEACGRVLSESLEGVEAALANYSPDGASEEGTAYWGYALEYHAFLVASLESALGSDFGRFDVPGIRKSGDTNLSLVGPTGTFNFSDSDTGTLDKVGFSFLAQKLGRPEIAVKYLDPDYDRGDVALHMVYLSMLDGIDEGNIDVNMPLDIYSRGIETVTMRSSWNDDALYVGMHTGDNNAPHSHLDMGVFVLDSQGERFFIDLGKDNYDLETIRMQFYRGKAEGHNCVYIVSDSAFDQNRTAICKIDRFESAEKGAFAVSDLTTAYNFIADSYSRGIKLTDNRQAVIIQDEISLKSPSELYWGAHTKADIEISSDGQRAILTQNGKKLLVKILEGSGGSFIKMEAAALDPADTDPAEYKNHGVTKLAIKYDDFITGTISIGMTAVYGDETDYDFEEAAAMTEWTNEEGEMPEYATLDAILIDGAPISGFDKDVYSYVYEIPVEYDEIPVVTATGAAQIVQAVTQNGTATVKAVQENKISKTYTVSFVKKTILGVPDGYEKIMIVDATASAVPQAANVPANTFDNDLSTRWSAENECDITFDLGSVQSFDGISLAFMSGDKRTSDFVIETSDDGKAFKEIYKSTTSGTTEDTESYYFGRVNARYIRLKLFGTSTGSWNSVSEAVVFRKKEQAKQPAPEYNPSGVSSSKGSAPIASAPTQAVAASATELKKQWAVNLPALSEFCNSPNELTREEFAYILVNLFGLKNTSQDLPGFSDIASSAYKDEIYIVYSNGIVRGVSDTSYNPNGKITRQEITVMLYRALRQMLPNEDYTVNGTYSFSDGTHIADWAKEAVTYMYDKGIMIGTSQEVPTISPLANIPKNHTLLLLERIVK